ncbi:ABC transporter ATP-binding protein [Granulosicoccaceae sp. 1_MG-2023]|nr:ABC transporter ATP-binding protein [Granulosicoccaceae sp. 1_MG-2023]
MSSDLTPDLETRQLLRRFGHFTAVDQIDLSIARGEFFSILGPSGCGKTTLLRMLAGFDQPDSGDILIRGESMLGVAPNKRPVNMVFQHLALFPMMNVADNIAYGLRRRGTDRHAIAAKVRTALESVDLPDAGDKRIDQLSGGQKQRVAIARALVLEPRLLLLDEPLGALDLKLREHMKVELKQLQQRIGTTFIYITHDQSEALVMSDRIAVMQRGRFEQTGSPTDLYYSPESAFVAGFVGDANRWRGTVTQVNGDTVQVSTGNGLQLLCSSKQTPQQGETVSVFVRPEAIGIGEAAGGADNRLEGRIANLLFNGANSSALLLCGPGEDEVRVALPQTGQYRHLKRGDVLSLYFSAAQASCFGGDAA